MTPVGHDPPPYDTTPRWGAAGIHGVPRQREWDAVVSAEAPGLPGDEVTFVGLADGSLVVDQDVPDGTLTPLADALAGEVDAPYRARAIRREGDVWAAAARRTEVVAVQQWVDGHVVDIAAGPDGRTVSIDGQTSWWRIPELEGPAEERFESYALHAERLDDVHWEVHVFPL